MKILARYDRLIAIVGTAVLTIGFYFGVFRPNHLVARQIEAEVSRIQLQLVSLPVQIVEREQMQIKLDGHREQLQEQEAMAPTHADVSDVLLEVADLAKQSRLAITRLEPLPQADFASYTALPFSLGCKGDFAQIAKFLSGLETRPRLVRFGEVSLTRGSDSHDRQIQASISFSVYSRHAKSSRIAENTARQHSSSSDN